MRVLITGGAGFIGSHIVDVLRARRHHCAVVDDLSSGSPDNVAAGVPQYVADIRIASQISPALDEFRPDAVCHQAAQMSVSRSVREPLFDGVLHGRWAPPNSCADIRWKSARDSDRSDALSSPAVRK